MTQENELRPCPFCGQEVGIFNGNFVPVVRCKDITCDFFCSPICGGVELGLLLENNQPRQTGHSRAGREYKGIGGSRLDCCNTSSFHTRISIVSKVAARIT